MIFHFLSSLTPLFLKKTLTFKDGTKQEVKREMIASCHFDCKSSVSCDTTCSASDRKLEFTKHEPVICHGVLLWAKAIKFKQIRNEIKNI